MFINKADKGYHNLCGTIVEKRRKELKKSQRDEARKRFVTDIALVYLAKVLGLTYETLLSAPSEQA